MDKWDLFAICESLLLVSDKPLTVEQVVTVLLREQEDELERLADEEEAAAKRARDALDQAASAAQAGAAESRDEAGAVFSAASAAIETGEPGILATPRLDVNAGAFKTYDSLSADPVFNTQLRSASAAEQLDLPKDNAPSMAEGAAMVTETVAPPELGDENLPFDAEGQAAQATAASDVGATAEGATELAAREAEASSIETAADAAAAVETLEEAGAPAEADSGDLTAAEVAPVAHAEGDAQDALPAQEELPVLDAKTKAEREAKREAAALVRRQATVKRELEKLVQDAFDALLLVYADPQRTHGRGFTLVAVGGAYQLRTNPALAPFVRHHLQVKPTKLSRAQLEVLAIVAYRQPVTRPEIEQIRGVDCGAAMKVLLDRKLVRILGKKEEVGRPLLYGTSKEFLEFFKLNSLLELPTLREFQELTDEHRRQVEEEIEAEAPLGNLRELAQGTPSFQHDDSALVADLDTALQSARATTNRVAELTGLKPVDDDAPVDPNARPSSTET